MFSEPDEEELIQDSDESEDGDDLEELGDDDEDVAASLALTDDDESDDEASLEELLAQRSARRGSEPDEDEDIMSLASEKEPTGSETISTKVIPIKDQQEFVCRRCYLVKKRSQLADEERMLCRDCA